MQTNAIMRMNLQYYIFLVFYGTFATCQAEETTEKVHSEKDFATTNEGNYLEQKNANDLKEKENTLPTPFSVAIIHSENRTYSSVGKNIIPIRSKIPRQENRRHLRINKNGINKRQSEIQSYAEMGAEVNPISHVYDTRENMYKPTIPQNRDITSFFPNYGNVYDYKRNSKRGNFKNDIRSDDLYVDDFGSWNSKHNSPYFAYSDDNRPLYEPNLAKELAGK